MKRTTPRNAALWPALLLCTAVALGCTDIAAAPRPTSPAASTLLDSAVADLYAGQPDRAAATLERALRIEPRNPTILHYLGQTRLQQGQYAQAEALAIKSDSLGGRDRLLRERNLRLLNAAREGAAGHLALVGEDGARQAQAQRLDEETGRRQATASDWDAPESGRGRHDGEGWEETPPYELRRAARHEDDRRQAGRLPRGQMPPPGQCRIWFPGRPPGQQPAPGHCRELRRQVPAGAWLVRG